jgi:signal transduction histidine kinase
MSNAGDRDDRFPEVVLDSAALDRLYPSHVRVDARFRVVAVGRLIDRLLPAWRARPQLDALFTIERPAPIADLAGLVRARDQAIILAARDRPGLRFKGEILPLPEAAQAVLLIVPWLSDPRLLTEHTISVGDFAIGDATPDLIFLIETQTALLDDMRRLTDRLKTARDEALSASRAKSEFLANASHELRTPLNAIIGFSEFLILLGGAAPTQRMLEYVRAIHQSGSFLLEIVNDLLDLARIEAGRMPFEETQFDLAELVRETAEWVRPQATQAAVAVGFADMPSVFQVRADRGQMRQILINLLGNAVKFNRPGGEVTIGLRPAGDGGVEITVSDTGIGVDPEIIPDLFQPFRQADSQVTRRYGGTGLGLHIVQRLVELHGGSVAMDGRVGVGTTVQVRLPASRVP